MRIKHSTDARSNRSRIAKANLSHRRRNVPSATRPTRSCTTTMVKNGPNCVVKSARQYSRPIIAGRLRSRPNTSAPIATTRSSAGKSGMMSSSTNAATTTVHTGSLHSTNSISQKKTCGTHVHRNLNSAIPTVNISSKSKSSFIPRRRNLPSISEKSTTLKTSLD